MRFYKYLRFILAFSRLCCFSSLSDIRAGDIQNSILPMIEHCEFLENAPITKYSHNQYREIMNTLMLKSDRIRVISYNIFGNISYLTWPERLSAIVQTIENLQPDIFALQGLDRHQWKDFRNFMDPIYSFYVNEDNSSQEVNAICYRNDRFQMLDQNSFHFEQHPAAKHIHQQIKAISMLQLNDRKTSHVCAIFNTRLTISLPSQQETELNFLKNMMTPFVKQMPVILTGYFNTCVSRDLPNLNYNKNYTNRILTNNFLKDSQKKAVLGHLGPITSATCYLEAGIEAYPSCIYVSDQIDVLIHAVEVGKTGEYYPSQDLPIIIDLIIR